MNSRYLTKVTLVTLLLLVLILASGSVITRADADSLPGTLLQLNFTGLEDLGPGWAYEGWLIVSDAPVSAGRFTVDADGRPSATNFPVDVDLDDVAAFILTIEPDPDPDPAPSAVHMLGGDFDDEKADLQAGHSAALGDDFLEASGSYILAVPSDTSGSIPYTHGIWWLDPGQGPGPSLDLPTLPAGWVYEGWVVGEGGPVSTGAFTAVDMVDSDAGGPVAGPGPTPPFPGQDFVTPSVDLTSGYAAVISIEPYPDNSPTPFTFKPLVDGNIDDPGAPGILQAMANNAAGFPTGTARLSRIIHYRVTLENMTPGQPFSPPVAATHRGKGAMFEVEELASPELEAIAEDGNQVPMVDLLAQMPRTTQVVDVGMPLTPQGSTKGGFTDAITFDIVARPGDRLSLATMLICTNDGFTGLDSIKLPKNGSAVYWLNGYDAGTEDNTELSADIVDPCTGLGPVELTGDPNGNINDVVDTQPRQPIAHHPGIQGGGDLDADHDWDDPVARVTVTRISDDAVRFRAPLSGASEVPPVNTEASGRATFRLTHDGAALRYRIKIDEEIEGVLAAHIHVGRPNENGGIVAFLFSGGPTGEVEGTLARGTLTESDLTGAFAGDFDGFVEALRHGELYVNVHTSDAPTGEIRGQIGVTR